MFTFLSHSCFFFFFFNDTATTEIYTLSLHDALPISRDRAKCKLRLSGSSAWANLSYTSGVPYQVFDSSADRKSTRLNSSHSQISYAVFCLKKKKKQRLSASSNKPPGQPQVQSL